jgi:hypothetical protein
MLSAFGIAESFAAMIKFYLDTEHVSLMPEPKGFWAWPDCRSQPIWVELTNSKRGEFVMAEDLFEKGLALLKKIQRGALPEDSQALYDRGMAMIQGEDPLAEEAVEETPEEEASEPDPGEDTVQPDEGTEGKEGEPQEIAPEGAESTVDSVMDEQLEEATKKALKDKPE